jgi:hypothetical protein
MKFYRSGFNEDKLRINVYLLNHNNNNGQAKIYQFSASLALQVIIG